MSERCPHCQVKLSSGYHQVDCPLRSSDEAADDAAFMKAVRVTAERIRQAIGTDDSADVRLIALMTGLANELARASHNREHLQAGLDKAHETLNSMANDCWNQRNSS